MQTLADMQKRFAQAGRVRALLLRPAREAEMRSVETAMLREDGFEGDRARAGPRAVTLIQAEHLPVIATLAGLDAVEAIRLRRNVVVEGLNLTAFRGKFLTIGEAVVELTVPCHPCSRMERELGTGGYTAMRGHGGMCAKVITPGRIAVGDPVIPVETE